MQTTNAWRDGSYLCVGKTGASLIERCIVCNAPEARPLKVTLRQLASRRAVIVTFAVFGPFLLMIAVSVSPAAKLRLPLCAIHRAREVRRQWLVRLLAIVAISQIALVPAMFAVNPWNPRADPPLILSIALLAWLVVAFVGFYVWLPYALVRRKPVRPKKIETHYAWLDDVHPDYLAEFPDISTART